MSLPLGKYVLYIDADKSIKALTDEQRKMAVDLEAGAELELEVQ